MYTVYQHINKINQKSYVGITKQKPENRWGNNGINYKSSPHFYAAIQKYGWDNFEHLILFENLSKEDAEKKEKELIKELDLQNPAKGYNIMEGGEITTMPPEICKIISEKLKGNKNGLNHPCSDEKKEKISKAQKGKKLTVEHKKELSKAAKNRHVPCSEEKKQILSKNYPHKKPVFCEELNQVFDSVQQAARELNLQATNVVKVCKGEKHTAGGYHFKYYNDTINA